MPHFISRGNGPRVICLHCSGGSSRQWQHFAEQMQHRFEITAIDLYGYGQTPGWQPGMPLSLEDEAALLDNFIMQSQEPVYLIGHSYGGAVAFAAALRHKSMVKGLIMYEPVLFNLFNIAPGCTNSNKEIRLLSMKIDRLVSAGKTFDAARVFVNYWTGDSSFDGMQYSKQLAVADKVHKINDDFKAIFATPVSTHSIRSLAARTFILHGSKSPQPVVEIAERLNRLVPGSVKLGFDGLGHMGPVTHRELINNVLDNIISGLES